MEHKFWRECWDNNKIAFHKFKPHKLLVDYFPVLNLDHQPRVLVPLCGKSLDMLWIIEQGGFVIGCELSEIAVEQFFIENNLDFQVEKLGLLTVYSGNNCIIYCGDFFSLTKDMVGQIDLVYDRAALVALPPSMRGMYVQQINNISGLNTQILLIVINYIAEQYINPPFSIDDDTIINLYNKNYQIEKLITICEPSESGSRLQREGIKTFDESVFRLRRLRD